MKRVLVVSLLALLCVRTRVWASSGTEGASFLDIPVGARPAALGSAYSALAADAYAPVWNPAGLGFVQGSEVAGQHLSYLESVHYEYMGLAQPLGPKGALGASIQYLGSGNIASADNDGNSIGSFSSHYASYNAAFGRRLGEVFALGATGKWIDARIGDFTGHAYAADIGAMFRPSESWSLAAVVTNIGSKLTFISAGDALPLAGHLSAAYHPNFHWTVSAEAVRTAQGFTSGRGGVEWRPIDLLALRAGYKSDTLKELSPLAGMTAGMGLTLWGQDLSYAWLPLGDLGTGHYFSFVFRFGKDSDKRQNLIYYRSLQIHEVRRIYPYNEEFDEEALLKLLVDPDKETVAAASASAREGLR